MTTTAADIGLATHDRAPGRRLGFLWGGIGALVPTVLSFTIVDHVVVGRYLEDIAANGNGPYEAVGYGVRIVILFLLGGFWAYLHHTVLDRMKLVQLGMLAPAMITGIINADSLSDARKPDATQGFGLSLIAPAYAQEQPPAPSPTDDFIRGLLGRP